MRLALPGAAAEPLERLQEERLNVVGLQPTRVGALHIFANAVDAAGVHGVVGERAARGRWKVSLHGRSHDVEVVDERTMAIRELAGSGASAAGPTPVVAPMPGLVVKVEVEEGDLVRAGQGIVIVEAMKMENELRASGPGRVSRVRVAKGDAVAKDQVLVELEALPPEASS